MVQLVRVMTMTRSTSFWLTMPQNSGKSYLHTFLIVLCKVHVGLGGTTYSERLSKCKLGVELILYGRGGYKICRKCTTVTDDGQSG